MKSLKEKIEVMQAALDGKEIEASEKNGKWAEASAPNWDWHIYDYRIKPEPREFFVNVYGDGLTGELYELKQTALSVTSIPKETIKVREVIE
jgi:hypothetical protein